MCEVEKMARSKKICYSLSVELEGDMEDMSYDLENIAQQMREGYRSGVGWDTNETDC
jgi:hypothetical protein